MTEHGGHALPAGFEVLEPFVADWSLGVEAERVRKRWSSDMAEITQFYEVMIENVERALDHLDQFELEAMPEPERRLFNLTMSLVEAASAVEIYGAPSSPYALTPERFVRTEVGLPCLR